MGSMNDTGRWLTRKQKQEVVRQLSKDKRRRRFEGIESSVIVFVLRDGKVVRQ